MKKWKSFLSPLKSMQKVIASENPLKIIILIVCLLHGALIGWLFIGTGVNLLPKPTKKLAVKTVKLNPPVKIEALPKQEVAPALPVKEKPKEPQKIEKEVPVQQPTPKKVVKKLVEPTKIKKAAPKAPTKTPAKKVEQPKKANPTNEKQKEMLKQAQKLMNQLERAQTKSVTTQIAIPSKISSLQIDSLADENLGDANYRDEIAAYLKYQLKLPEYGEVKLRLTLARSGLVSKIEVLQSKSSLNKNYVEMQVPNLKFPSFGNLFNQANQYSFTILLKSE